MGHQHGEMSASPSSGESNAGNYSPCSINRCRNKKLAMRDLTRTARMCHTCFPDRNRTRIVPCHVSSCAIGESPLGVRSHSDDQGNYLTFLVVLDANSAVAFVFPSEERLLIAFTWRKVARQSCSFSSFAAKKTCLGGNMVYEGTTRRLDS